MKRLTPKQQVEQARKLPPSQIEAVRTVYDEIVYIAKGASMRHMLRLYRQDGIPLLHQDRPHGDWHQDLLHPDNICTHDRATWVTYYCPIDRKQIPYCPICTPAK